MTRPLPFHASLSKLAAESREKIAAEKLGLGLVKEAAIAAALQGLNGVTIPIGPVSLGTTNAARELASQLKGVHFEWVESLTRDGQPQWDLRLSWAALTTGSLPE
jgi:hypothetical protein